MSEQKKLVEQKVIRSTIDGFVINRFKSEGEFVEDQPILRVAQLDPLNIEAIIPMKYFGLIQPGMQAEVNPEMLGLNLRQAQVTVVDRVGDAASGTFGVRLEMSNPGFVVPAGLKCDVKFLETSQRVMAEAVRARKNKNSNDELIASLPSDEGGDQAAEVGSAPQQTMSADIGKVNKEPVGEPVRERLKERLKELAKEPVAGPIKAPINEPAKAPPVIASIADNKKADKTIPPLAQLSAYVLGPFESEDAVAGVINSIRQLNFSVRAETIIEETPQYMVLAKIKGSRAEEQLNAAGMTEYYYNRKAPHAGRYSLGVFNAKDRADALAAKAGNSGVPSDVLELIREKTQWWIDLKVSAEEIKANGKLLQKYEHRLELVQLSDQSH